MPVVDDRPAEHGARQERVEIAAVSGDLEIVLDQLRPESDQIGARRPEGGPRALAGQNRGRIRERREVACRHLDLAQAPGTEAGDPMHFRDRVARAGGGAAGERQGAAEVAGAEIAARDRPARQIGLDRVDQNHDRGPLQLGFGRVPLAGADQLVDPTAPVAHRRVLGGRALQRRAVVDPHQLRALLTVAAEIAAHRPRRRRRAGRLPAQRQAVDPIGARMVGVVLEPRRELGVGRVIALGHVALPEHVAEQEPVAEPGDQLVGGDQIAGRLQLEDAPVERDVAGIERARQHLIAAVRHVVRGEQGDLEGLGGRQGGSGADHEAGAQARHQQPA